MMMIDKVKSRNKKQGMMHSSRLGQRDKLMSTDKPWTALFLSSSPIALDATNDTV